MARKLLFAAIRLFDRPSCCVSRQGVREAGKTQFDEDRPWSGNREWTTYARL